MVIGIVCEFDPLHRGHARLLSHARALGADTVVCAMSGSFTQRGSFAALSKTARAEMAVRCGADLVLELPTPWAMSPAETFARGGVRLLALAGADTLLFGSECGDLPALRCLADCLDSPTFADHLTAAPESGLTFCRPSSGCRRIPAGQCYRRPSAKSQQHPGRGVSPRPAPYPQRHDALYTPP